MKTFKRKALCRLIIALIVFFAVSTKAVFADDLAGPRRYALVIGNSKYPGGELSGARDAEAMAVMLEKLGFTLPLRNSSTDLAVKKMNDALTDFSSQIGDADVVVFYFSGHGFQVNGNNYLVPLDGTDVQPDELDSKVVSLENVYKSLRVAQNAFKIIILDACRSNTFSTVAGLTAPGLPPSNTLIIFATGFDQISQDGNDDISPFTRVLLSHIDEPGLELRDLLVRVRQEVRALPASPKQTPWDNSYYGASEKFRFYFKDPAYLNAQIENADDDLLVLLNDQMVLEWKNDHSVQKKILLKARENKLTLRVFNDKTYEHGHFWEPKEGWNYNFLLFSKEDNANPVKTYSDGEDQPGDDSRWGAAFTVAEATVYVHPHSGAISFPVENRKVWVGGLPPAAIETVLYNGTVGGYDDSWQTKTDFEVRDLGLGIKTTVPVIKTRALRHELHLLVVGPANLQTAVAQCLSSPEVASALGNATAQFLAHGDFSATTSVIAQKLAECLGKTLRVELNDNSHWTDWS